MRRRGSGPCKEVIIDATPPPPPRNRPLSSPLIRDLASTVRTTFPSAELGHASLARRKQEGKVDPGERPFRGSIRT
jgi:hypothetical protein